MKIKIVLFFIFLINQVIYGQDSTLDSLKTQLQYKLTTIEKVKLYNEIANELKYSNPNEMLDFGNKALTLAKENKFAIEEGRANLNLGTAHIILGNYDKSLAYFLWAKAIFEELEKTGSTQEVVRQEIARTYGSMGIVFSEQNNYAKALEYYLKSVNIYEEIGDETQGAKIYNNIGVAYQSQFQFVKALEYFLTSLEIQKKLNNPNVGITQTNMANIYFELQEFDKAFAFYTEAKKSIEKHPNPRALGEWHNNIGAYYKQINQNDLAFENWQKAISTFKSINDKFGLADTYAYLAQYYLDKNEIEPALEMVNEAISLATEIQILEQQSNYERLKSAIYEKANNQELALVHFKKHSSLKDSLLKKIDVRKSVEAAMKYEFEKKEILQKEENEKRELLLKEEAKNTKIKLISGALIALLLLGIGFLIYNRNTLKKTLTLQKELAEYEQKALHLQMNPHFVFNCLGSISSFIVQNGTDSAIKYLSKFSKLMRLTLEYSKESLIPIDKEIESLENYLELEQLRFNNKFNFKISKSENIDDDLALPPLLIQPFIENAIIHGVIPKKEIGNISIDFSIEEDSLKCVITDDGIGFSTSKKNKENSVLAHKSMALDIIQKRLEMISNATSKKATITIEELNDKSTSTGTQINLTLPLRYINE